MHIRSSISIRKLKFETIRLLAASMGDGAFLKKKYIKLYGIGDFSQEISQVKRENRRKYLLAAIFFLTALMIVSVWDYVDKEEGILGSPGKVTAIIRPKGDVSLDLNLRVKDEETILREATIALKPPTSEEEEKQEHKQASNELPKMEPWEEELDRIINDIGRNWEDSEIYLPDRLSDGRKITWEIAEKSRLPIVICIFLPIFAGIYRGRHRTIKRSEDAALISIINEMPEFINKLVLLLNAGLVLSAAFTQIIRNYQRGNENQSSYFYSRLSEIAVNMKETNSPFHVELKGFAKRTGVRELMRFSNIVCDNIDKGAELVDKLQREAELLWVSRKKIAEEQGRLAETKLTLPLMIMLLVLIMVTITPAMMEI